jgi:FkbM family methyltransferase
MHNKYRGSADIRTALSLQMRRIAQVSTESASISSVSHIASIDRPLSSWFAELRSRIREAISKRINFLRPLREDMRGIGEDLKGVRLDLNETWSQVIELSDRIKNIEIEVQQRLQRIEQYSYSTARRVAINCGSDAVMIRTAVGYVLCPPADYPLIASLIETGDLEKGTRLLIEKLVRPRDVFVDVGANIGLHTLAAARAVNGMGRIIAFEPFRPTADLCRKSAWLNGFSEIVEIHQVAASDHSGRQRLYLGPTCGHHSLFELNERSDVGSPTVDVDLVTLDEVLSGTRADLIKIDVEGAELEVIEGSRRTIDQNPEIALIVEFGPSHLRRRGHSTGEWLSRFEAFGMIYRAIDADSGSIEERSIEQLENAYSTNLIFSRPGSSIWQRAESREK